MEIYCPFKADFMYLDVSLAVDVHVNERAEPNQTLPHFHIALPEGQNDSWNIMKFHITVITCLIPNIMG